MNKNLESLCFYKRIAGLPDRDKSRCSLECEGYDRLCKDYQTLYDHKLSDGFQEGGYDFE